jgi:hypothetical protein
MSNRLRHSTVARSSHATRFWSSDRSLTILLVLLLTNIFALPLLHFEVWVRFLARAALALVIASGLIATVRSPRLVMLGLAFTVVVLFVGSEAAVHPSVRWRLLNDVTAIPSIGLLIVLVIRQIFREGPITMRRIQGAVAVYLMIGLTWALVFDLVELVHPGSFSIESPTPGSELGELSYFSFTTMTSLGTGDIVPASPLSRSLVVMEALMGQLFPAILLARLVAMELSYRQRRREARERRF